MRENTLIRTDYNVVANFAHGLHSFASSGTTQIVGFDNKGLPAQRSASYNFPGHTLKFRYDKSNQHIAFNARGTDHYVVRMIAETVN